MYSLHGEKVRSLAYVTPEGERETEISFQHGKKIHPNTILQSLYYSTDTPIANLPGSRQPGRSGSDLCQLCQRIQVTLELRLERSVGIRASDDRRTTINRRIGCTANLERRELVIGNSDRIDRVAFTRTNLLTCLQVASRCVRSYAQKRCKKESEAMYLSNNLWIRLQLNQAFCKASGMCMIVRLPKYADRTSQGNLQMRGLKLAMRKVGSEFQIACHVARILGCHSSSFQLNGNTKQVFSGSCYRFSPLQSRDETSVREITST